MFRWIQNYFEYGTTDSIVIENMLLKMSNNLLVEKNIELLTKLNDIKERGEKQCATKLARVHALVDNKK